MKYEHEIKRLKAEAAMLRSLGVKSEKQVQRSLKPLVLRLFTSFRMTPVALVKPKRTFRIAGMFEAEAKNLEALAAALETGKRSPKQQRTSIKAVASRLLAATDLLPAEFAMKKRSAQPAKPKQPNLKSLTLDLDADAADSAVILRFKTVPFGTSRIHLMFRKVSDGSRVGGKILYAVPPVGEPRVVTINAASDEKLKLTAEAKDSKVLDTVEVVFTLDDLRQAKEGAGGQPVALNVGFVPDPVQSGVTVNLVTVLPQNTRVSILLYRADGTKVGQEISRFADERGKILPFSVAAYPTDTTYTLTLVATNDDGKVIGRGTVEYSLEALRAA